MTVTRNDQLRQWRWEEVRRRRLELDAWQDRVFRQWVFLQTVRTGLFLAFGSINWALFNAYTHALPSQKVERIVTSRGASVRLVGQIFEINPRTAIVLSVIGVVVAIMAFYLEIALELLISRRVARGIVLEDQIGIQTGFFRDVEFILLRRVIGVEIPVGNLSWFLVLFTLGTLVVWCALGVSAYSFLPRGG